MIPYTIARRPDTGVTNVTMGVWLFLASEVMLFGALFSAYALMRVSAPVWPIGRDVLNVGIGALNTVVLLAMTAAAWRARPGSTETRTGWLLISTAFALVFLAVKSVEYRGEFAEGLRPAANTFLATYFTLTGLHALHVLGGAFGNLWAWAGAARVGDPLTRGRVNGLALYWTFVDLVWLVILVLFYLT